MTRWFAELRDPALKCARVGHAATTDEWREYRWPSRAGGVADRVTVSRQRCRRCGHTGTERITNNIPVDGLSMDAGRWDDLYKNGRLRI